MESSTKWILGIGVVIIVGVGAGYVVHRSILKKKAKAAGVSLEKYKEILAKADELGKQKSQGVSATAIFDKDDLIAMATDKVMNGGSQGSASSGGTKGKSGKSGLMGANKFNFKPKPRASGGGGGGGAV